MERKSKVDLILEADFVLLIADSIGSTNVFHKKMMKNSANEKRSKKKVSWVNELFCFKSVISLEAFLNVSILEKVFRVTH